jgi:hypothetical protein
VLGEHVHCEGEGRCGLKEERVRSG